MAFKDMRTVIATFGDSKEYAYFVPEGDNPQVGDYLLTSCTWDHEYRDIDEGASNASNLTNARIAKVRRIETEPNPKATRFYVVLLSCGMLAAKLAQNKALTARVSAHKAIIAKLDKKLKERSRLEEYRLLASVDPEAQALLAQLED